VRHDALYNHGRRPSGCAGAGALAERFDVRTGLACVAACALTLAVATVFGTGLRAFKD
jgi:hypothetical protein